MCFKIDGTHLQVAKFIDRLGYVSPKYQNRLKKVTEENVRYIGLPIYVLQWI